MSKILVVIGSARKGRVADKILTYVEADLAKRADVTYEVADLAKLHLPFFDNENSPLSPEYVISDPQVAAWSELVKASDSVLFITPEYNHTLSAIQKNAVDSLGVDWGAKPITAVGYGWTGGSLAVAALAEAFSVLKGDVKSSPALLGFMKDINVDGTVIDAQNVSTQVATAIDQLV